MLNTHQQIIDAMEAAARERSADGRVLDEALRSKQKYLQGHCAALGHIFKIDIGAIGFFRGSGRFCVFCNAREPDTTPAEKVAA